MVFRRRTDWFKRRTARRGPLWGEPRELVRLHRGARTAIMVTVPITIFDSDTIPRDRRAELEAAVVAAGRHLSKLFEGWIVATPDRRRFAVGITSNPELDISVPFDWNVTPAEVTEGVRAAMDG